MKKKIIKLRSLVLCLVLSGSLAACNNNKHEAKAEWMWNETQHWHECATEGHDDKLDEADHTWGEWAVKTAAKCEEAGVEARKCSVCQYEETREIPATGHTYATTWSSDATKHWHAATCGHNSRKDEAEHVWDEGVITTPPTTTTPGVKTYTCTVCKYQKTETIAVLDKTAGTVSINASYAPGKTYDKTPVATPVLADCTTNNAEGAFSIAWYQKVDGVYGSTPLAAAPVNAGDYKVVIKIAETDDYTEATAEKEFTIVKKQLTVKGTTVDDKNYDGNTTANVTVGTLEGVVEGEDVTVSASGTFASAAVGNDITVTVTYRISGADSANYLAPETDATLTADILDYAKFTITKTYLVTGRGMVVEGTLEGSKGSIIKVGDILTLFRTAGGSKDVPVSEIRVNNKVVESVTPETKGTVALLLRGIEQSDIAVGDYLIKVTS